MTSGSITLVDVLVLRGSGASLECLLLRRGREGRCPGSWEMVHGHVEPGELPADAALRELREETGHEPLSLYNLSRVESFYVHRRDAVMLVGMFAAFVAPDAGTRIGPEHEAFAWRPAEQARREFAWPREVRCLDDAVRLIGSGSAGPLEDVLRVC